MPSYTDQGGTTEQQFILGKKGVGHKRNATTGGVDVVKADGSLAPIQTSKAFISGDEIEINSDAAGTGSDRKLKLARPTTGMTADVTLTFPATVGSPGQVLSTDGTSGQLSWVATGGSTTQYVACDTTTLAAGSASPITMFSLPANAVVHKVQVILDTIFNGTNPTATVGTAGTPALFMGAQQNDLKGVAGDVYEATPAVAANASAQSLIITYSPDSASTGSARFLVHYSIPA